MKACSRRKMHPR